MIGARTRACIMVVHHTAKGTRSSKGDMGAGRGAFAAVGKVRSAFTICRVAGDDAEERAWLAAAAGDDMIRVDYSKVSHDRKPRQPAVFRRRSAPVGNGSAPGVPAEAAEFFAGSPHEALVRSGDHAPVLELVDHRALSASAGAGRGDDAKAREIASVVLEFMGDLEETKLGGIWAQVGAIMRERGLTTAKVRNVLVGEISAALRGEGVTIQGTGQSVTLRARKRGPGERDPWWIERVSGGVE